MPFPRGLLALALTLVSTAAFAAGWGAPDRHAVLGERLDLTVAAPAEPGMEWAADCVAAEVHLGERPLPPHQVRVLVQSLGDGQARVRVQTLVAVDEPWVSVHLQTRCGTPHARHYPLLADPAPAVLAPAQAYHAADAASVLSAPATAALRRVSSDAAPRAALRTALRPVALQSSAYPSKPSRPRAAVKPKTKASARGTPRTRAALPPRARLQLDAPRFAVASEAAVEQALQAVAQAAAAARQSASAASAAADRIAALERTVEQLRGDSQAQRNQAAALREQLARADASSPWLWGLGGLSVLLGALTLWLMARLVALRQSQQAAWKRAAEEGRRELPEHDGHSRAPTSAMAFVHSGLDEAGLAGPRTRPAPAWPPPAPSDRMPLLVEPPDAEDSEPGVMALQPPLVRPPAVPTPAPLPVEPAEPAEAQPAAQRTLVLPPVMEPAPLRDVSIDELLDLEQQADFFVVLGQDESAIDLLVEHLRQTGGGSPMPYLKLLEIHRRRGERSDYERMRVRFNHRFNAYAPEWEVDLQSGRALESYPGVLPRLQQVWPRPLDAMAELEALMFRKDRGDLFELPAYREVLFLYALARDLLDREAASSGTVDLLLPLAGPQDFSHTAPVPFDLPGAGPAAPGFDFEDRATAPVDLDLSLDIEPPTSIFDPLEPVPTDGRRRR